MRRSAGLPARATRDRTMTASELELAALSTEGGDLVNVVGVRMTGRARFTARSVVPMDS
jgi:hypothetical protein